MGRTCGLSRAQSGERAQDAVEGEGAMPRVGREMESHAMSARQVHL